MALVQSFIRPGSAYVVQGGVANPFRCANLSNFWDTEMPGTITSDSTAFALDTDPPISARWSCVTEIVAFKRDLFTTDMICIQFQLDDGTYVELDEEMVGYRQFIDIVTSKFDLAPNWWSDVAFPAFKTNKSTIWSATT